MRASSMPKLSWMTLAKGARQLVVQEALLEMQGQTRLSPDSHMCALEGHKWATDEAMCVT